MLGGVEHRLQVPEVGADGLDLGGQDDLLLVGDGLGVVALHPAAQPLDDLESGSVTLTRPSGVAGGV